GTRGTDDLVVGHDGLGKGQGAGVRDPAAPQQAVTVGDGQAVDAHRRPAADPEDPTGVATADGQPAGARPVDPQIVRYGQLPGRQGDRAPQPGGEGDDVGTGVGVGGRDCRPQRVGAAVGEVLDREGAGDGAILQLDHAQTGRRGTPRVPCGT